MDNKNISIALFLHDTNAAYLHSILPRNNLFDMEQLMSSMQNFINANKTLINNLQNPWKNVRYLNKLFVNSTEMRTYNTMLENTKYSSFGEADFLNNQVKYGDTYNVARDCYNGTPYRYLALPNNLSSKDSIYRFTPTTSRVSWTNNVDNMSNYC